LLLVRGPFVHTTLQGKDSFTQGIGDGAGAESHEAVGVSLRDRSLEVFHLVPIARIIRRHVSVGWDFQEEGYVDVVVAGSVEEGVERFRDFTRSAFSRRPSLSSTMS